MNRRDDIRAAMQSLLCSTRPETRSLILESRYAAAGPSVPIADVLTEGTPRRVLEDLRGVLSENGIEAQPTEIAQAIMEALVERPSLCRGLLASYLLEG